MDLAKAFTLAFFLLFGVGCARSASVAMSPSPVSDAPIPSSPNHSLFPSSEAFNAQARADHMVGSIAAHIGIVRQHETLARNRRDVIKLDCVKPKLDELRGIERRAHDQRTQIMLSDNPDTSVLASLDDRARSLELEVTQCVGAEMVMARATESSPEPDRDADGIMDEKDVMPEPENIDGLESKMDALKEETRGAKARLVLIGGNVLGVPSGGQPQPKPPPMTTEARDSSMLIRTAEIALAVYEVEKNLDAVDAAAKEVGGYLAMRTDREITIRVPRQSFDQVLSKIERMGDVLHKNVAAEDVTDQWVDLDMRLKNALAVRARLEKLLDGAAVRDAIEIHKELTKVTEEIERLQGKLKLLGDRISYSSITVSFQQSQTQQVRSQALLPFPWMATMGLSPLLQVHR